MMADRHQPEGQHRRFSKRHINPPQEAQKAASLNPGRFVQFARNGAEGLAQEKDRETAGEIGQADGQDRIHQTQSHHGLVIFDQKNIRHDQKLHQDKREEDGFPRKLQPCKGKGRQRAQDQLHRQDQRHQKDRVQEVARERGLAPGGDEILQRQRRRQHKARLVSGRMKGGPQRIEQRRDPKDRQHPSAQPDQDTVGAHL